LLKNEKSAPNIQNCKIEGKKKTMVVSVQLHSYDILGAGMLWKPKEARIL
jgi:hypothetical protein